jgi:hypothetical protein
MFEITQISNPVINVSEGKKLITNNTSGSKAAAYTYDLLNTTKPTIIDYLEFATDNMNDARLRVYLLSNGTEILLRTLNNVGSNIVNFTPFELTNNNTGLFSILEYNDVSKIFKFGLNKPIYLPEGGRIQVSNTGAANINLGCLILGREL